VKEEEPGVTPKSPHAMFPTPMPRSSWLGSSGWPLLAANDLVIAVASSIPMMAIAITVLASCGTTVHCVASDGNHSSLGITAISAPSSCTILNGTAASPKMWSRATK